jgi:protein-tyrosine phosphatase
VRNDQWYGLGGGAVRPSPPRLDRVLARLYVGEYPNIADVEWLRDAHRVTAVVCLQDDADLASKRVRLADLRTAYDAAGVAFVHLPVADGDAEALAIRLPAIVEAVATRIDAGDVVYLHCNGGMNRAPTAAIAYLHVRHGLPVAAALEFVKRRRTCVPYVRALELAYGAARG